LSIESAEATLGHVRSDGSAIIPDALSASEILVVLGALQPLDDRDGKGTRGGRRDLFTAAPALRFLAAHPASHRWPSALLGPEAFVVQAILFDKTPDANWKVAWHQDLTIPVEARIETAGFGPWSGKDGVPHVQASRETLEGMLIVRIHLDRCDSDNGPLRVIPGSHAGGRLAPDEIDHWKAAGQEVEACVPAGGLLLMRPLLLHASSPARRPGHRRVIHLEYAAGGLPGGLSWRRN
jgi:ectoine hydroxylase-related dioxygenase (phytanoyl-CoA dioxygenase family)